MTDTTVPGPSPRAAPRRADTGLGRAGSGWQLLLTDLSLILFMVTAGTLMQAVVEARPPAARAAQSAEPATPLAIYRVRPGAPPLADWLTAQDPDARQQLTIVARYRPGDQAAALAAAATRLRQAGAAGARARVIVEPGAGDTAVTLAFDAPVRAERP